MMVQDRLAEIVAGFQAKGRLESAERYGSGHIHDTYSVRLSGGSGSQSHLLFQRLNTRIFRNPAGVMDNIERVTSHVRSRLGATADADRRVLRLLPARDGKAWLVDREECYWRAYHFIEGARSYDEVSSARQAFEAARAFGEFQRILADLPGPRLVETLAHFHDTPKRYSDFELAVALDAAGRRTDVKAEIEFAIAHRAVAGALAGAGLPERVTHNDTKLNNVLLDEQTGEGICVIDLDTVMPGLAAFDFGDMVRTMTCPTAEDEPELSRVRMQFPLFEAVLRGYLEGAGGYLTNPERESLIRGAMVIVFEQGIRFLADYLRGDSYYKVSRPGQNLDRARTQFTLFESMVAQQVEMTGLLDSLR